MSIKARSDDEKIYSTPILRKQLKDKLLKSTKGGKTGQWTARNAQLLTKEYIVRNGQYKINSKTQKFKKYLDTYNAKANQRKINKLQLIKVYKPTLKIAKIVIYKL